jgi:peptidyl-dipeptidase A
LASHPDITYTERHCTFTQEMAMKYLKLCLLILVSACQPQEPPAESPAPASPTTPQQAQAFMDQVEPELASQLENYMRVNWLAQTYINTDTQRLSTDATQTLSLGLINAASRAAQFGHLELEPVLRRKMHLLKLRPTIPPPNDEHLAAELAEIGVTMRSMYGVGEYCREGKCYTLQDMSELMAESHDADLLRELWTGWREVAVPMRPLYQRQVEIANAGARDLGFANLGEQWRSKYDMNADVFAADAERKWEQLKPLYTALHCHARAKLNELYGDAVLADSGKIPAHLLGNMWAQSWVNIYDLVAPASDGNSYDLNQLIEKSVADEEAMVKIGEAFFSSLGFEQLPETFWQRSQFVRPRDREVICHASAWNIDAVNDLRIKMCIKKNAEDFKTIHHELGHNYYQRAYSHQPPLFRGSANDGFHEALGDTIALSITPGYLVQLGLLDQEPPTGEDLGYLMHMALEKVAILPFALMVDKWRWQVFSGELSADSYNRGWWELREQYQGVMAPTYRSEADFDPGAKYHIPANTPYSRYFLAHIQQFQFHRALCEVAGFKGPLHRCSIYNNADAGAKMQAMMEMGRSQPWQDAMEVLTGQRELDATALLDYFAPLKTWLDQQNQDRRCGWAD